MQSVMFTLRLQANTALDTATVRLRMSDPWYFVHRFEDDAEEYTLLSPVIGLHLDFT